MVYIKAAKNVLTKRKKKERVRKVQTHQKLHRKKQEKEERARKAKTC